MPGPSHSSLQVAGAAAAAAARDLLLRSTSPRGPLEIRLKARMMALGPRVRHLHPSSSLRNRDEQLPSSRGVIKHSDSDSSKGIDADSTSDQSVADSSTSSSPADLDSPASLIDESSIEDLKDSRTPPSPRSAEEATATAASTPFPWREKALARLQEMSSRYNEVSGYEEVERLKQGVAETEQRLTSLRQAQVEARSSYQASVSRRSNSQRTLNDLLSRKSSWSDSDLSQYTSLLRSEHAEAVDEKRALERCESVEREVEACWDELVRRTLERYHEEWKWSERGRSFNAWISAGVVGLNVIVFMAAIILVEPYKRRRLAEVLEKRVLEGEAIGRAQLSEAIARIEQEVGKIAERVPEAYSGATLISAQQQQQQQNEASVDEVMVNVPSPSHPTRVSIEDENARKRELALAGGVGFAFGAGLLALIGAAWGSS